MRLLMPITFPSRSNSGPPESPPTSRQSVWMSVACDLSTRPTRTTGGRSAWKPIGCPIATHHVPGFRSPELPFSTNGHLPSPLMSIKPASPLRYRPNVVPVASLPSGKWNVTSNPGFSTTWPAVITWPSSLTITPLPWESPI
ncbi:hypothetical protein LCGC14_3019470 [marine sediment metagenome]|uniref:Uncharacterized protein n=1 Tax=marine sediment metagenome TaxID=412755 RepID=A0A0F8ZLX5_9ZZZZ